MDAEKMLDEIRADIEQRYKAAISAIEDERKRKLDALLELSKPFSTAKRRLPVKVEVEPVMLSAFVPKNEESKAAKCRAAFDAIDGIVNVQKMREKIEYLYGPTAAGELANTVRTFLWSRAKRGKLTELQDGQGQMKNYEKK